jgi:outer membrane protein
MTDPMRQRIHGIACECLLLLGMLHPCAAAAQARTITFEDAVGIALERNPDLRRGQIDTSLNDADVRQARMQFMPDLRLDVSGLQNTGRNFNATQDRIVEQTTHSLALGVSSRLTLFNGFRDVANLNRAQALDAAGRLDLQRTGQAVVFDVAEKFLTFVLWQEQSRVQREYLAGEVELETQIRYYVEAGARAVADLYQQQANVAAAKVAVIDTQAEAERAMVEVMRTLQLDPAGTYDLQPPAQEAVAEPADLQSLLARAQANRMDVHAAEARLEAAEQNVRVAGADYWPTLTLDTGYASEYTDASAIAFNQQLDQQRGRVVALNITVPLFDRNAARHASRRAQLQSLRMSVELDAAREDVGLQVRQAYMSLHAARERLTAADAQQHAAERAAQTAQERFRGGAYSLVELSKARTDLVDAQGALARARVLLSLQQIAMQYVVGDINAAGYSRD